MNAAQRMRMGLLLAKIKMGNIFTVDAGKDPNPENWRTINGAHVHLSEGKIDGGAGGKFHGKAWAGKVPHGNVKNSTGSQKEHSVNGDDLTEKQRLDILSKKTGIKGAKAKKMLEVLDDWTAEGGEFAYAQSLQAQGKKYGDDFYDEGAKLVEEYISKAPKFTDPIYRGIVIPKNEKAKFLKALKAGKAKINDFGSTQSWSSKENVAKTYAEGVSDDDDLRVVFFSKQGHPMGTSISHFAGGAYGLGEVIVSKDAKWSIKKSEMKDGIMRVEVEPHKPDVKKQKTSGKSALEQLEEKLAAAKASGDIKKQIFFQSAINKEKKKSQTHDANYPKDPNPDNWRTINGSKVHLENGKIDGGAGGKFSGTYWKGKVPHTPKAGGVSAVTKQAGKAGASEAQITAKATAAGKAASAGAAGAKSAITALAEHMAKKKSAAAPVAAAPAPPEPKDKYKAKAKELWGQAEYVTSTEAFYKNQGFSDEEIQQINASAKKGGKEAIINTVADLLKKKDNAPTPFDDPVPFGSPPDPAPAAPAAGAPKHLINKMKGSYKNASEDIQEMIDDYLKKGDPDWLPGSVEDQHLEVCQKAYNAWKNKEITKLAAQNVIAKAATNPSNLYLAMAAKQWGDSPAPAPKAAKPKATKAPTAKPSTPAVTFNDLLSIEKDVIHEIKASVEIGKTPEEIQKWYLPKAKKEFAEMAVALTQNANNNPSVKAFNDLHDKLAQIYKGKYKASKEDIAVYKEWKNGGTTAGSNGGWNQVSAAEKAARKAEFNKMVSSPGTVWFDKGGVKQQAEAAYKHFESGFKSWEKSITPDEKAAVVSYTGSAYSSINSYLREQAEGKAPYLTDQNRKRIHNIDEAMKKTENKETIRLRRGVSSSVLDDIISKAKDGIYYEAGYTSTSPCSKGGFDNSVELEIVIPPGKGQGQWVEPISVYKGGSELEFIVARGAKYKVCDIDNNSNPRKVQLILTGFDQPSLS